MEGNTKWNRFQSDENGGGGGQWPRKGKTRHLVDADLHKVKLLRVVLAVAVRGRVRVGVVHEEAARRLGVALAHAESL